MYIKALMYTFTQYMIMHTGKEERWYYNSNVRNPIFTHGIGLVEGRCGENRRGWGLRKKIAVFRT
jgi:hypothetical protein